MELIDLKDIMQTPKDEPLSHPKTAFSSETSSCQEQAVVKMYAELRNADKEHYSLEAKRSGGYITSEGQINYPKFAAELRHMAENEHISAFVAYKTDASGKNTPVGLIAYGPSTYPDNRFMEYVDTNDLPVVVYGVPGNSIQIRQMLFSEELSEKEAKEFFISAINAAGEKDGVIMEVDQNNNYLMKTLYDLGFIARGMRGYEIGKTVRENPHFPWEAPHTKQYTERAEVMYGAMKEIFGNIHSDNIRLNPRAKTQVASEERLPALPKKIQGKSR